MRETGNFGIGSPRPDRWAHILCRPALGRDRHNPDLAAFAELCGAKGIRVTNLDRLSEAVGEAIAYPGPALVEVVTDPLLV